MRRPLLAALVALAAAFGVLVAQPPPAIAAGEVTVTWPSVTKFNPDLTPYEITVDDSVGTGVLVAWWEGTSQLLEPQGVTVLDFASNGTAYVEIYRCSSAGTPIGACTSLTRSPLLSVYDHIVIDDYEPLTDRLVNGAGSETLFLASSPRAPGNTYAATWELIDISPAARVVASGSATVVSRPEYGNLYVPISIPRGLDTERHLVRLHLSTTTPDYGRLVSTQDLRIFVDQAAPVVTVSDSIPVVYPARDHYLDYATFKVERNESGTHFFEVRDDNGRVLQRISERDSFDRRSTYYWDGRVRHRTLPAGQYRLTFGATDYSGNTTAITRAIRISDLKRQMVTYRRTVPAASYLTSKYVGRCSTLAERGKGLVYGSQSKCRGTKDEDSLVIARHGIYVPRAIDGRYGTFRVTVNGQPASRSRGNYLVLGYINGKEFTNRVVLRDGKRHPGRVVRAAGELVFDRTSKKPYVIWSTGLTAGSRYVVRSFTVEITYYALARVKTPRVTAAVAPHGPSVSPRAASYL